MGAWLRRGLHAATAGVLVVAALLPWHQFRVIIWVIALLTLLLDAARLLEPGFHRTLARLFPVFRPHESRRPSGAAWLWLGYALAVLAPPSAGRAGILVAALADPVAAIVGERFGMPLRKSMQGSVAGLVVAAAALAALRLPLAAIFTGAIVATLLERWPGPFDDNLLVAPGVALAVTIVV
jgi:dolichol kinase